MEAEPLQSGTGNEIKVLNYAWGTRVSFTPFSHLRFVFRRQGIKDVVLILLPSSSAVLPHTACRNSSFSHPEPLGCSGPNHHGSHYWDCLDTFSASLDRTRASDPLCFCQQIVRIKYLLRLHLKDTLLSPAISSILSNKLQVLLSKRVKAREWCLSNRFFTYWCSLGTERT